MGSQSFEKINRLSSARSAGVDQEGFVRIDKGQLIVESAVLEFRGQKGSIQMTPVRDISFEGFVMTVSYGEEASPAQAYFQDMERGMFRVKSQTESLANQLRSMLSVKGLDTKEVEAMAEQRNQDLVNQATRELSKGRRQTWIGGILFLAGAIFTLITYSRAAAEGGQYFIAYGALLAGGGALLTGITSQRSARRRIAEPWRSAELRKREGKNVLIVVVVLMIVFIGIVIVGLTAD